MPLPLLAPLVPLSTLQGICDVLRRLQIGSEPLTSIFHTTTHPVPGLRVGDC